MSCLAQPVSDPQSGLNAYPLDDCLYALYLEVPGAKVVMLQGFFESYEGLATVRTLDLKQSLVCLLATYDMLADCFRVLQDIKSEISWRPTNAPDADTRAAYLGYHRKEGHKEE